MQPETRFKLKVKKDLETLPGLWFFKTQQVALRGIPDFILCVCGWFFAIELKKDGRSKTTPLQDVVLQRIKLAKGRTFVTTPDNWSEVFREIRVFVESACKEENKRTRAEG